jgi:hypothetical protein
VKALSIRQPWAWLIVNGYKDIENRSWNTKYRGRVLVHASKGMTLADYESAKSICDNLPPLKRIRLPLPEKLEKGGIVGYTHILNCIDHSDSPWFFGPKGFVLSTSKPLPFTPMKGKLSFFETGLELAVIDGKFMLEAV